MILRKSVSEIARMLEAGAVVARAHDAVADALAVGVSTATLDDLVRDVIVAAGARASFLGYGRFPAHACISVGPVVAHGIPSADVVLAVGDVVRVDIGAEVDGYHGDAARTHVIGAAAPEVTSLVETTRRALAAGIAALQVGGHLGDIGAAIQAVAQQAGLGIVDDYVGHGIGRSLHEDPAVANTGRRGHGPRLDVGWVLAIEPMFTLGSGQTDVLDDTWAIVTRDRSASAHWEHTVALTADGPQILTERA